jgi:hypothetical protein
LGRLLGVTGKTPEAVGGEQPIPPRSNNQDACQFIIAQLALMPGASSHELAVKYAEYLKKTQSKSPEVADCKTLLEAAARELHQSGHVHATPNDDGIFLLPRRR